MGKRIFPLGKQMFRTFTAFPLRRAILRYRTQALIRRIVCSIVVSSLSYEMNRIERCGITFPIMVYLLGSYDKETLDETIILSFHRRGRDCCRDAVNSRIFRQSDRHPEGGKHRQSRLLLHRLHMRRYLRMYGKMHRHDRMQGQVLRQGLLREIIRCQDIDEMLRRR